MDSAFFATNQVSHASNGDELNSSSILIIQNIFKTENAAFKIFECLRKMLIFVDV